jgi:uncharacterized glyoxalase superfamily protein PhnB
LREKFENRSIGTKKVEASVPVLLTISNRKRPDREGEWNERREVTLFKVAVPLLRVSDCTAALTFYCDRLGFQLDFAHRAVETMPDPCYAGISRDSVWLHLSSFSGDGVAGGVANILVDDVDALHAEFVANGVAIAVEPVNQTWGTREMYVTDADNNCLRFQQP